MSLACPACGAPGPEGERFCATCGVPLVPEGGPLEARLTPGQQQARRIKPQYAEGRLVRVAIGRQQPEAEFIQNLLLDEGVPSTLRRTRGFDVPEMLSAGPRDVLVPESGVATAREVLLDAELADRDSDRAPTAPARVLAGLLAGVAVVFALAVLIDAITV